MTCDAESVAVELRQDLKTYSAEALQHLSSTQWSEQEREGPGGAEGTSRHGQRPGCFRVPQQKWIRLGVNLVTFEQHAVPSEIFCCGSVFISVSSIGTPATKATLDIK